MSFLRLWFSGTEVNKKPGDSQEKRLWEGMSDRIHEDPEVLEGMTILN